MPGPQGAGWWCWAVAGQRALTSPALPCLLLPCHRSAGAFADLVQRSFYNGMEIQRADGFVVQTGKPDGDVSAACCRAAGLGCGWGRWRMGGRS